MQNFQAYQKALRRLGQGDMTRLRGIEIAASPVFARQQIEFAQLTVVTGIHGSGKSFLLRMVAEALLEWSRPWGLPPESNNATHDTPHVSGVYRLLLREEGRPAALEIVAPIEREANQKARAVEGVTTEVAYVSATTLINSLQTVYGLLRWELERDEVDWNPLSKAEMLLLGSITGHAYTSFEWAMVLAEGEGLPLFRAVRGGQKVTHHTMSAGEVWAAFTMWIFWTEGTHEIVLIDEPETFISPRGHRAFVEALAITSAERGRQTIVATHSPQMISAVPEPLLRTASPTEDGVRVYSGIAKRDVLRILGVEQPAPTLLLFTEDVHATRTLEALLQQKRPDLLEAVEIVSTSGASDALRAASFLQHSRIRAMAVLDGDQRGAPQKSTIAPAFLPGLHPEETALRLFRENIQEVAVHFARLAAQVQLALDATRFEPHQNWLAVIEKSLSIPQGSLYVELARLLCSAPATRHQVDELIRSVDGFVQARDD